MTTEPVRQAPPCALVIFGASGDLTERKLLPAVAQLARQGHLNEHFALIGVARTDRSDEEWAELVRQVARDNDGDGCLRYVSGGYDDGETYDKLAKVLTECDESLGTDANRVFYLSTPPRLF